MEKKIINTFMWVLKATVLVFLFVMAVSVCSAGINRMYMEHEQEHIEDSCKYKEMIQKMVREEVNKQLTEIYD